jgi:hypothetical protein
MPRMRRSGSRCEFHRRYGAYARDHGMTGEQMLAHDRICCPESLLKPYLQWLSLQRLTWTSLNSQHQVTGVKAEVEFDRWLRQISSDCDAITCECHIKLTPERRLGR